MEQQSTPSSQNSFANTASTPAIAEAASHLMQEGKKMANHLYEDGKCKMSEMQDNMKWYSDSVASGVQKKPMMSLLVACGVGYIVSSLWRH